jgi:hypothetical protein
MRSDARFAISLALVAASGLAVLALPRGYKEDFNGCATQSPDATDRERCCKETGHDCLDQCLKDFAADPGGGINCQSECTDAFTKCKDGKTVRVSPDWPGISGADVPGLTIAGDRTRPEKGYDLVPSRSAVLVELRARGLDEGCAAFVVACQCPAGAEARGQECRAFVDGSATACRICPRGGAAQACKPCPDCRPEMLSAQACSAPNLPAPRRHGAKAPK